MTKKEYPEQKFKRGDVVHIAKDLGPSMAHFENDREAIIMGSYRDQYGGLNKIDDYTVMFIDTGSSCSWYHTHQLTFIRHGGEDEIHDINKARHERDNQQSDLDWIFSNGTKVLGCPSSASIEALALCLGVTNLWGSRGEGITYSINSMRVMALAEPFLKTGDKESWLEFCKGIEVKQQAL